MAEGTRIDHDWLADHPLPPPPDDASKNTRGSVVVVGGCAGVPGGLRLTGEGALRAGAGKLRLATVRSIAVSLGMTIPEAGMMALPEDGEGEIGDASAAALADWLEQSDCVVVGPAMKSASAAAKVLETVLARRHDGGCVVIDAAAIAHTAQAREGIAAFEGRAVLTPNGGEAAHLLEVDLEKVEADPAGTARRLVDLSGAIIVLKGPETIIATPAGEVLHYPGGGVGLATGGSGDVQSGLLGGLLARGVAPRDAAAWAVWLHGEAGRLLAERIGPVGYLARELLPLVPSLMLDRA